MKVTLTAVINGFAEFLSKELKPQYPTGTLGNFMMGFSSGLIRRRAEDVANILMSNALASILIIDGDGKVDLDQMMETAQEQVPENGITIQFPFAGEVTFRQSDTAVIRQYIERASG